MTPFERTPDARVRTGVFAWLSRMTDEHGPVLPRTLLARGLEIDGVRVPLVGPQGIFKPRILTVPLSITTAPEGPYKDELDREGRLRYRYRGTNSRHPDNVGLRTAMANGVPLVYFFGLSPGRYVPIWPVFIVEDDPANLAFAVVVDDKTSLNYDLSMITESDEARRAYVTSLACVRLHQHSFRERVLAAYRWQCAFCRLRHEELLEAAHIIGDREPEGEPLVNNGLSLCALHHTAFDRFFVGLRPDYVIEVRPDILQETDGPTLVHAIQKLHGTRIVLPSKAENRPDRDLLERRYERFRAAS